MATPRSSIWIGFDSRPCDAVAFAVARHSIRRRLTIPIPIIGLVLDDLRERGLYWRPTEMRDSDGRPHLWDVISQAPMATEFAISRFLVPHLAESGLALFLDGDMLARANLARLFEQLEGRPEAVWCVKHRHEPQLAVKMGDRPQTRYARKNWSSFVVFNCDAPANRALTLELVNTAPGRDLHRFCWLADRDIGELDVSWNWLAGESDPEVDPKIVHHTLGSPAIAGFENAPYADEWRRELREWARA